MPSPPKRYETDQDYRAARPIHVVWELTLACNLRCAHCGSRAGRPRPGELSTEECLEVVAQLARLGVRDVALIGGEAYLRRDWLEIVRAVRAHGMDCTMQTGGRGLSEERVARAAEAGLTACGVSIDGLEPLHDRLRGVPGSYRDAVAALGHLQKHGVPSSVNTQITGAVMTQLRELLQRIAERGAKNWQLQLTVAMGNAADHPELLLQPYQLLDLMPLLADLYGEALDAGVLIQPGNNIGYFGPYEHLWRVVNDGKGHWQGCTAGQTVLGLEADGTVKGCPSLPTSDYTGGNVRDLSIEQIWEHTAPLRFTRDRTTEDLWGFCASCYYADVCRAGCTWTTHVLFGRAGNNPYCHYRARELARRGLRERIVKIGDAPGRPFDHGRFALVLEPLAGGDGGEVQAPPPARTSLPRREGPGRVPPVLELCHGCEEYVLPGTTSCPHCGGEVQSLAAEHAVKLAAAQAAAERLRELLAMR